MNPLHPNFPKLGAELTQDLVEYKKAILYMMDNGLNHYFPNDSASHAAIVYEVFLEKAQKDIRMFCSHLSEKVFKEPNLVEALRGCLARGVSLKVVSEEKPDETPFLHELKNSGVDVFTFDRDIAKFNFCVMDSKAFRFEEDSKVPKAYVNMNHPDRALSMVKFFDDVILRDGDLRRC